MPQAQSLRFQMTLTIHLWSISDPVSCNLVSPDPKWSQSAGRRSEQGLTKIINFSATNPPSVCSIWTAPHAWFYPIHIPYHGIDPTGPTDHHIALVLPYAAVTVWRAFIPHTRLPHQKVSQLTYIPNARRSQVANYFNLRTFHIYSNLNLCKVISTFIIMKYNQRHNNE